MVNSEMRQWFRRVYLRQHAQQRRAAAKAAGAKRIDVTLQGDALDDYARVKDWLDQLTRLMIELGVYLQQAQDAAGWEDIHGKADPAVGHGNHPVGIDARDDRHRAG